MLNKKIIISLAVIAVVLLGISLIIPRILSKNQNAQKELSVSEIMQIVKTDAGYNNISKFMDNFDPELISYSKLGAGDYQKIKPEWQKQSLESRVSLVDKVALTNSTFWVEIKNKNDSTKGLLVILDTKEKKSLLLITTLSVKVSAGI